MATPWAAAHQAPPSMGFSRQEYWSRVPLKTVIKSQAKRAKEEDTEKNYKNHSKTIHKMARIIYLSIINLNVDELNAIIKRDRVAE